jgi:hypothetical protein
MAFYLCFYNNSVKFSLFYSTQSLVIKAFKEKFSSVYYVVFKLTIAETTWSLYT